MLSIKAAFMSLSVAALMVGTASSASLTYTGSFGNPDDNAPTVSTFTSFETGGTPFDLYDIGLFAGGFNAGDQDTLLVGIYDGSNGTALASATLSFTDLGSEMEYFAYLSSPLTLDPNTTYWLGVTNQGTNTARWYKTASSSDFTSPDGVTVTASTDYYTNGVANVPPTFATATAFEMASPEPSAFILAGLGLACVAAARFLKTTQRKSAKSQI